MFTMMWSLCTVSAAAATKLTVHVVEYMEAGRQYYLNVVKPAFEKEYPGLELELEFGGWTDSLPKLATRYAAGVQPDAMQFGAEALSFLLANDMIVPLDQFVQKWGQLSDYPAPVIADGRVDGKLWTIPYSIDVRTFTYRRDLFSQAGLDPEKAPTTWDEIVSFGKRLTRYAPDGSIDIAGLFVGGNGWQLFAPFFFQAGGQLFTPDFKQTLIHAQPGIDALRFLVEAVQVHRISTTADLGNLVSKGKIAMGYQGFWVMQPSAAVSLDDVGVALPTRRQRQAGLTHVNKWAIVKSNNNPADTWKWIEFVNRPDILAGLAAANKQLPPRLSVVAKYEPWNQDPRWMVFYNCAQLNEPIPGFLGFQEISKQMRDVMPIALRGERSVPEIMEEVGRQVNLIIADTAAISGSGKGASRQIGIGIGSFAGLTHSLAIKISRYKKCCSGGEASSPLEQHLALHGQQGTQGPLAILALFGYQRDVSASKALIWLAAFISSFRTEAPLLMMLLVA
ncbi:MAG TPA: extracellular solute-binding protein [Firmicutes bacterium]|nr:extracellular solute-binding protein [Bacillota bacterium]